MNILFMTAISSSNRGALSPRPTRRQLTAARTQQTLTDIHSTSITCKSSPPLRRASDTRTELMMVALMNTLMTILLASLVNSRPAKLVLAQR